MHRGLSSYSAWLGIDRLERMQTNGMVRKGGCYRNGNIANSRKVKVIQLENNGKVGKI